MATLYRRRTGYWYIKYKDNGRWIYASTGHTDREEAENGMRDALDRLQIQPDAPARETLSWSALDRRIQQYGALHLAPATTARYRYAIKAFKAHSGTADLQSVTPDVVDRFKRAQLQKRNAPATINNYLRDLRVIAGRALSVKWCEGDNPFTAVRLLPESKRHPLWLDAGQISLLLSEAEKRGRNCHLFAALGIYEGFRKSESVEARWGWFDFGSGLIHIQRSETWGPKDADERTLPMHNKLRALLERYRGKAAKGAYVLAPGKNDAGKWRYRYEPDTTFATARRHMGQRLVDDAEKRGEVLDPAPDYSWITPHVLRHTFASQLVSAGVDLYKVSVWLGHADVKTTQIYAHLQPADRDINRF